MTDAINPNYYQRNGTQLIDVIEDLPMCRGNAVKYLVHVVETVGEEWLQPYLFRFGASSLLNDVLLQRQKLTTGRYSGPDYVTID